MEQGTMKGASLSKTIKLGFMITLLGFLQANVHTFAPWIDQKWIGLLNMLLGMGVIIVRFYTDSSLADKGRE